MGDVEFDVEVDNRERVRDGQSRGDSTGIDDILGCVRGHIAFDEWIVDIETADVFRARRTVCVGKYAGTQRVRHLAFGDQTGDRVADRVGIDYGRRGNGPVIEYQIVDTQRRRVDGLAKVQDDFCGCRGECLTLGRIGRGDRQGHEVIIEQSLPGSDRICARSAVDRPSGNLHDLWAFGG